MSWEKVWETNPEDEEGRPVTNNRWEDVLGNPGGGYSASDALKDIGGSPDSSVGEVAGLIQEFCREIWGQREQISEDEAIVVARDLLSDIK